jgi:zinc protease
MLLLLVLACAKHPSTDVSLPMDSLPWDPGVQHGTLKNGMAWYIEKGSYPAGRAELRLAVRTGAAQEDPDQYGAAHILEHMAFQGGAHFGPDELVHYLESVGMRFGPDTNAHTDMQSTVYELRVPSTDLAVIDKGLSWFQDVATSLTLGDAQLEHERSVVLEEWRRGQGVGQRYRAAVTPVLLPGTVYATHETIGTEASIRGMTREALQRYWETWYRPDAMAVIVAGDVDPAQVQALFDKELGGLPTRGKLRGAVPAAEITGPPRAVVFSDPELTATNVSVSRTFARKEEPTGANYRENLARGLILGVMNERLGERGIDPDAPFIGAGAFADRLDSATEESGLSAKAKSGRVADTLAALLEERERAVRYLPTAAERARAVQRSLAGFDEMLKNTASEDPAHRVEELIRNFLTGESVPGIELEARLSRAWLPALTDAELRAAAIALFPADGWCVEASSPANTSTQLPSLDALKQAAAGAAALTVSAPVDLPPPPPLVSAPPKPGAVTATRTIPEMDAVEWTLPNGAKVIVRPSTFKADEIRFKAISPGGFARDGLDDLVPGTTAVDLATRSGLGDLDLRTLARATAGTNFSVSPFLNQAYEGFTGRAVPADLETALAVMHQYVVAPRFAADGLARDKQSRSENLRDRLSDPDDVASDAMVDTLWQGNAWRRSWTVADLDHMDLARSQALYAEHFANIGDWTFVFVGSVDLATFKPMVETWLGSLPGTPGFAEPVGDDGARPVRGVHKQVIHAGQADKATVTLTFTGDYAASAEERVRFGGMIDALNLKLRAALREKEAGVYGVSASSDTWTQPWSGYRVDVSFTCDPARADALTAKVFEQITALRTAPLTDDTLDKVRSARLRSFETDVKSNSWWMGTIAHVVEDGDPVDLAKTYPTRVAMIQPDTVQAAAKHYLDLDNYVLVERLPAN